MKSTVKLALLILGMALAGCENEQGDNGFSHNADIASQYGPHGAPVNPTTRGADMEDAEK